MSLSSKLLESRDLPEIFKEICLQRMTGVFYAERLKYKRSVYFQNGSPIFATSNLSEDKIGKILFTRGKITMDQLMQALDKAKNEKKRLGSVLVEMGYIAAKDLFEAVVFQVEQILYSLFEQDWRDARFSFDSDGTFGEEVIKLSIHPTDVILEGIRRSYNPDLIAMNVGDGASVYAPTGKRSFEIDKLKISPEEKRAFVLLDGRATLDEVTRESGAPKYKVSTLIYALKVLEFIELKSGKKAAPQPAKAAPPPIPKIEVELESPEPEEAVLEDAEMTAAGEETIDEPTETIDEPAEATEEISESLDLGDVELPDNIMNPPPPGAAKTPAPKAPSPKAPAPKAQAPKAPQIQAEPRETAPPPPPAPKPLTAEELKTHGTRLKSLNYYQRLEVEPGAPSSAVVTAYSTLRRRFEGDLPVALRQAGKAPLALVAEAYKALSVDALRAVYDEQLAQGGPPLEIEGKYRVRAAALRFADGTRAWDAQSFEDAGRAFRESIELDPAKPDYYFGLGLVMAAQETGAPRFEEVEAMFTKAAALQSDHPRGYYYLGTLFRVRGENDKAATAYQRALSLDARYEPAREGLKACQPGA